MKIDGTAYRTVWVDHSDGWSVRVIDQTKLPWSLEFVRITGAARGGARHPQHAGARRAADRRHGRLWAGAGVARGPGHRRDGAGGRAARGTRPTAINLRWALDRMLTRLRNTAAAGRVAAAYAEAALIADEDVEQNAAIGRHGQALIEEAREREAGPARQRAHRTAMPDGWRRWIGARRSPRSTRRTTPACPCMSGWTRRGRATRARSSPPGSWASTACRTPSISDNAGGHLMQHGRVDLASSAPTGSAGPATRQQDRHLSEGARGARQRRAVLGGGAASSTIDWPVTDGVTIPIEERDASRGDDDHRAAAWTAW